MSMAIIKILQIECGDQESEVHGRQILTLKVDRRTEIVNIGQERENEQNIIRLNLFMLLKDQYHLNYYINRLAHISIQIV